MKDQTKNLCSLHLEGTVSNASNKAINNTNVQTSATNPTRTPTDRTARTLKEGILEKPQDSDLQGHAITVENEDIDL